MFSSRREGHSRRTPGFHRKSLFQLVLALAAGRPVFTASYYVYDPINDDVASLIDWNDPTHLLDQPDQTKRCSVPAAHADFAGKPCLNFVAASDHSYDSNRTAASWDPYTRAGTPGGEGSVVLTITSATAGIVSTTGTGVRQQIDVNITPQTFRYSGVSAIIAGSAYTVGTPTYFNYYYQEGASPEVNVFVKSVSSATGSDSPALASGPFRLGKYSNGSFATSMRLRAYLFFPVLTAQQRSMYQSWVLQDSGIAP